MQRQLLITLTIGVILLLSIIVFISLIYQATITTTGETTLMNNPLLTTAELPSFHDIKPEHFEPAIDHVLKQFNNTLWNKVLKEKKPTWNNSIMPLEEASYEIDKVWKLITHLNAVLNTDEVRKEYEKVLPKITAFDADLMQNEQLYQVYLKLKESPEFAHYDRAQQTIINHAIRNFKLSGVVLPAKQRQRFKQIKQRLSELSNQFSKNVLDATQAWEYHITEENKALLDGLPEHSIMLAKKKAEQKNKSGWVLTIDFPCYYAVITFAKNRELRKTFYYAHHTRASDQGPNAGKWDNTPIIDEILKLRQEKATMLGYKNYAEYSLVPKMAANTKQVMDFMHDLVVHTKAYAEKEYAELEKFAKEQDNITNFSVWDVSYYSELYQTTHYKISQESLRPYFPEPQVLSGMFKLAERLFGIKIREIADIHKWHDTVKLFAIYDNNEQLRGKFYIDLYARDFKYGGAWMADFISRLKRPDGTVNTPVAFLEANFTPPVDGKPALLSHDEVITLFHEFGHSLHHLLTQVDYPSVAGTNGVAWDAVELPSQFMENWAWEWEVIKDLSKHYQTGEPLPKAEFDKLLAIKNYHSAMQMVRQLEFALFDFRLHLNKEKDRGKTPQQILNEVRQEVAVLPIPAYNRFQNSFTHIFDGGYDAGYFSYKWAEVLSCDAFERFKENGTFSSEIGNQFLKIILEQGGSREAMELFVEFRGRKPTIEALLKHNGIRY